MSRSGSLIKNTLVFAIGSIGSKLLQFLLLPLYTRVLTDAQYGTVDILQSISTILIPLISLTIYEGVFRYAMDKATDKRDAFSVGIHISFLGSILAVLCGLVLTAAGVDGGYVWAVIGYTVSNIFFTVALQFVRAIGFVKLYAAGNILQTALIVVFNVLFLVVMQMDVEGYMLGYTLSNVAVFLVVFAAAKLWKYYRLRPVDAQTPRRMLLYSIPLIPNAVCWWLISTVGRLMITAYLGSEANGPFAVAFKIPSIVTIAVGIFIQAWQMSVSTEYEAPDFAQYNSRSFGYLQTISFVLAAFLALCSKVIIGFMGEGFQEAWVYIPVMLLGITFYTFAQFLGSLYIASKRTLMAFVTNLAAALLNVVCNFLLLPRMHVMGAAVSITVTYLVLWLLRLFNTRSIAKLQYNLPLLGFNIGLVSLICLTVTLSFPGWIPVGIGLFLVLLGGNAGNIIDLCKKMLKLLQSFTRRTKG